MKPEEILRLVEQIHLERKIDREIVFGIIEQALTLAARKHGDGGDDSVVDVHIDRQSGEINAYRDNLPLAASEIAERIGAQTAKQVIIQKIRDAERDMIYDEYFPLIGQIVSGTVRRNEGRNNVTYVALTDVEAILPYSEKIPRENYRPETVIKALVIDVKKVGAKVKVVLSRSRPLFVQRLLEQEIPEISENVIEIVNVSREAGRRTKVAVVSNDPHIDLVGACVGVRGARSRAITDELGGERIDVVPWTADTAEYIRNALKPAIVDEVMLCTMLGRAIVLVQREQRSIAIGRGGQNVRLASRLCKWDVDVMNRDELDQIIEKAMSDFMSIDGVDEELADALVGQGFLSFDDLSIIEPSDLMSLGNLTEDQVESITSAAEELAQEQEAEKEREKQLNDEERSEEDSSAPQL
ncbi:MAG: transcription termination factor NusA [Thermoguttaceae bacterium]|nr:transcription termination factor NusA [Thermoguttaceae bacterium]